MSGSVCERETGLTKTGRAKPSHSQISQLEPAELRLSGYSEIQSRGHLHDKQTTTDFRISRAGFIVKYSLKFLGNMLPCKICSY